MRKGIIAALLALGIAACGGSSVSTADVQNFVTSNVGKTLSLTTPASATCVQATDTTWTCAVDYSVLAIGATASEQAYEATVTVTCDDTGTCIYPAFSGTPVNP